MVTRINIGNTFTHQPFFLRFLIYLVSLISPVLVSAQTTLFTETIGTPSAASTSITSYTGWSTAYTMTGTGTVDNTTPYSSGYTGATGNGPVVLTQDGTNRWWQISGVNTSGHTSLSLSFGIYKQLNGGDGSMFKVEVSSDGTNYTVLSFTSLPTGGGSNGWYLRTCTGTIPSTSNLRIRFTNTSTTTSDHYRLDDVKLTGTAVCVATTPTVTASGTTSFCSGCSVTLTSSSASAYSWSNGATTQAITATTSGDYTVTITDGSGCRATSAATTVTVSTCNSHSWTGNTSSAWSTGTNWNKCAAPGTTDNVTIPDVTTDPVISGTANCSNLTIDASAVLTINSGGILNIYGNITNNGTYTDNGTTVLTGSTAQAVTGATTFNNLTLNNSNGVTLNNATTVAGVLTLTTGTLASGGNLTVDLNTGSIAGTGTGAITGNVILYKTVNSAKYHYISSPLSGLTVAEWNDDVEIKFGQYKNLYSYNETYTDTTKAVGWEAVTSLSTSLESMKGYALYFYGATTMDVTGTYTHSDTYSNSNLTNTVSNTDGSAKPESDGWHLIGNPYPSTLDWDAASGWTKTNIDGAIYFWDPVNSRYATYVGGIGTNGGSRYIPSMQAFWVKANLAGGSGTLAMDNNVRVTSTNPAIWRKSASSNLLKLSASNGMYRDETIIRFIDNAEETFDAHADAYKMRSSGNSPSLYTMNGKTKYSINSLPLQSGDIIIPVKLEAGFSGAYMLTAEEAGSFGNNDSIILEDRLLGIHQDLRSNPTYTCEVAKGDTAVRFFIHFRRAASNLNVVALTSPSVFIKGSEQTISVNFSNTASNNATIVVSNAFGQEMFFVENADISSGEYSILLPSAQAGIYVVKVLTGHQSAAGKVFLSK